MLSYHDFRAGTKGRIIVALITHPDTIAEMTRRSRRREPAVAAIDRAIVDEVGRLDDTERQHTGRVVRDVLAPLGWHPTSRKRLRASHVFASGAVYEPRVVQSPAADDVPGDAAARFAKVRAAIAASGVDLGTVDDFLLDRRHETNREAGRSV